MKKTVLLGAVAFVLAACGSSNEASESHFKKVIEESGNNRNVCLPLMLDIETPNGIPAQNVMLGEPVILISDHSADGKRINQIAEKQLEVLEKEGLYRKLKTDTRPLSEERSIKTATYELTDKGVELVRGTRRGPLFCVGKQKIGKINWFTTPTPDNGLTVSEVSYQVELKPEKWADKLIKASEGKWKRLKEPYNENTTLVQTNKGWRDIREMNR